MTLFEIYIKRNYVDSDWFLIENTCFHRGKCISLVCVQWFTSSVLKPVCPWPILRRATKVFVDSRHNKIYQNILNFFKNFEKMFFEFFSKIQKKFKTFFEFFTKNIWTCICKIEFENWFFRVSIFLKCILSWTWESIQFPCCSAFRA